MRKKILVVVSIVVLALSLVAAGRLEAAQDSAGRQAQKYFDQATAKFLAGDLDEALQNVTLSLSLDPRNAGAAKLKRSIEREIGLNQQTAAKEERAVEAAKSSGPTMTDELAKLVNDNQYAIVLGGSLLVGLAALWLIVVVARRLFFSAGKEEFFCPSCGHQLASSNQPCPNCGNNTGTRIWASISEEQKLWYRKMNWKTNPFTLNISHELFTGFDKEVKEILEKINTASGHILITGPLGIGKTTLLRWLAAQLPKNNFLAIYVPRPPLEFNELVRHIYASIGIKGNDSEDEASLYNLNKMRVKLKKNLVILMDEAHEFTVEVERPLRTLGDIDGVTLVMAGLPESINKLKTEIQPLYERLVLTIFLDHLAFGEIQELIRVRIENAGGKGIHPFTAAAMTKIYEISRGNPRATIKVCDAAIGRAIEASEELIGPDFVKDIERAVSPC